MLNIFKDKATKIADGMVKREEETLEVMTTALSSLQGKAPPYTNRFVDHEWNKTELLHCKNVGTSSVDYLTCSLAHKEAHDTIASLKEVGIEFIQLKSDLYTGIDLLAKTPMHQWVTNWCSQFEIQYYEKLVPSAKNIIVRSLNNSTEYSEWATACEVEIADEVAKIFLEMNIDDLIIFNTMYSISRINPLNLVVSELMIGAITIACNRATANHLSQRIVEINNNITRLKKDGKTIQDN